MTASHEATKQKLMPFILDTCPTTPYSAVHKTEDVDVHHPQNSFNVSSSSSLARPSRTHSTTTLLHHSLRLPLIVPEDGAVSSGVDHNIGGSPRRPRASIGITKPRTSAERVADRVTEEDAGWWTEEIQKRREIRRRWKEVEDENTVVIGNKVDTNHPNYVTAYNMLTGLRVAVSRVSAKVDRELTDEDFKFRQKFTFDNQGNELSPASKHDFKFKDYAPWVFRHLRALFHLDTADYLISLTSHILLSELGSPGKSGSFFYFSRDYRFVIKTLHHAEHLYLRQILRQYYEHVKSNPNTLISQFYGLHRVKMRGRKVHLVVINNVFPAHRDIHQTYDLKGSTVGREFDEAKLKDNPKGPLKDLNWINREMSLQFGPRKKHLLMSQLKKDVELLSSLNIMDYSLLIGIHDLARGNSENIRGTTLSVYQPRTSLQRMPSKKGKESHFEPPPLKRLATNLPNEEFLERKLGYFTSEDGGLFATNSQDEPTGDYIYYFGVIDLLTTVYGVKKHLETFFKGFSSPKNELSAIPPDQYADRFVRFIRTNVNPKDIPHYTTREDLSHIAIPEESPITTPSAQETREKSPSTAAADDFDVVRTVIIPRDHPLEKLPAIRVQHPSPELKEGVLEREMVNGMEKPLVNGLRRDYFGEISRGEGKVH